MYGVEALNCGQKSYMQSKTFHILKTEQTSIVICDKILIVGLIKGFNVRRGGSKEWEKKLYAIKDIPYIEDRTDFYCNM